MVERRLWRGPKTAGTSPDAPLDLRLWEIIPNNTVTSIRSTRGSDAELSVGPIAEADTELQALLAVLGLDEIWPHCARYIWHFDGRVAMS